jgi:hypothetical protein
MNVYVGSLFSASILTPTASTVQYQIFKFNAAVSSSLTPDFALYSANANYRKALGLRLIGSELQLI